jgi:iron complex outermembrane receptor protein
LEHSQCGTPFAEARHQNRRFGDHDMGDDMQSSKAPRTVHALCWLGASATLAAQPAAVPPVPPVQLPPVVVTATRTETPAFDVPASISAVDGEDVRNGRVQVNISESLGAIPGLQARDRQNYAQDVQISVRGFGARSTFGIRGVRLYVDGIPATLPDGQGQVTHVELGSVGRIEVLRGPFSALYGNSSGGVIQVFTEDGQGAPRLSFDVSGGSDGLRRYAVQADGSEGSFAYRVGLSRFETDGYREHSAATRHLGNAKLSVKPDESGKLTLVVNSLSLPDAQDPLGLTRAQFEADPRSVDPAATNFNTRKSVDQTQGGLTYERRIDAGNTLRVLGYKGKRGTGQFQSIPTGPQGSPLHPGGVISLSREYEGADLRWTWKSQALQTPLTVIAGLSGDWLYERRRGYQNFIGTTLGVQGELRRDELNEVVGIDQYVQANWQLKPQWTLNAGARRSRVSFKSSDAYVVGANPDDSGGAKFTSTLPVVGVLYAPNANVRLHLSAGKGFETPTLNELAYRAGGDTGLNFALQSASSRSVEAGIKTRFDGWGESSLAVFETRTRNEIVTQTNSGGRTTFQNAGATRRRGVELGWSAHWPDSQDWQAQAAATWLDAIYRDSFTTCSGTPCLAPNQTIPAGNRIPGLARAAVFAAVNYAPPQGLRGGVEVRRVGAVYVNDANTDAASAYTVVAAHAGYRVDVGRWSLGGYARVDNLFDRRYAGSVIVNEGNSRFFEPAPGRSWAAGVSAAVKF